MLKVPYILKYLSRGSSFGPFRSTSSHFQDNAYFIIPNCMLTVKKNKKNCQNFKHWSATNLLTRLKNVPKSIHMSFVEWILCLVCTFRDVVWNFCVLIVRDTPPPLWYMTFGEWMCGVLLKFVWNIYGFIWSHVTEKQNNDMIRTNGPSD